MVCIILTVVSILILFFFVALYTKHKIFIKRHNYFLNKYKREQEEYLEKINKYIKDNPQ